MSNDSLTERLSVTQSDQDLRMRWIRIEDEDLRLIREAALVLRPQAEAIVREFYDHSFSFPVFVAKVEESRTNRERLEGAQKAYFLKLLEGRIDTEYFEQRLEVGARHAVLNVEPRWNVGNYAYYLDLVAQRLAKKMRGEQLMRTLLAFQKVFVLDATLAVETYISEGVLQTLVDVNETLGESSGTLSDGAGQVNAAAQEIATAITEIAQGATDQTDAMNSLNDEMGQLAEAIGQVADGAEEQFGKVQRASASSAELNEAIASVEMAAESVASKGAESLSAANEGKESVGKTVDAMETIRAAVTSTAAQVGELSKRAEEIGAIVQVIDDIAGQTNLLALNAAIEAARAGEQGRGFAVVAENVRSLAERTAVATKEIGGLITATQEGTARAVQAMEASVEDVQEGADRASEAGGALDNIVAAATEVSAGIQQIATAARQMATSSSELSGVIDEVGTIAERVNVLSGEMREASERSVSSINRAASVAEQSAAASEQVSASVQEVTAQIGEVTGLSEGLATVSAEMAQFLARFGNLAHNSKGERFELAA